LFFLDKNPPPGLWYQLHLYTTTFQLGYTILRFYSNITNFELKLGVVIMSMSLLNDLILLHDNN